MASLARYKKEAIGAMHNKPCNLGEGIQESFLVLPAGPAL